MKYFIETYGCQMNSAESYALELSLQDSGWIKTDNQMEADLAIINTCSVRQTAENRIWGRLSSYIPLKKKKKVILIVTGCMAERLKDSIKDKVPQIDYVVSSNDKMKIPELVKSEFNLRNNINRNSDKLSCCASPFGSKEYFFSSLHHKEGSFSSYVPIMNGCNNYCSYCIVPYVRGREVSRSCEEILNEVKILDSKGVKEITLLGQNVNSYSFNEFKFSDLLKLICSNIKNIEWVRFESPHPKDFSDKLIDVIANEERIAKHFHIPMQSGNNRILSLMNRKYTREQYLDLIDKIRNKIKNVTFATDVMVGFPSETDKEFEDTLSLMDFIGFIEAYMYYWNPREGTKAMQMENKIDEKTKRKRLQTLIDFQLSKALKIKEKHVENFQKVLVVSDSSRNKKNQMLGYNEHNEMVVFDVNPSIPVKPGDFVNVNFLFLNGKTFVGKLV